MKFGKEFTAQMVQEWQQVYMDYNLLKSILKDILTFRQRNTTTTTQASTMSSYKRKVSLYRAFSGLTRRNSPAKRDDDEIFVSLVKQSGGSDERYQTMLLNPSGEGGDKERAFFGRLDEEFNKVLIFYKKTVEEVIAEADELTGQMNVLIALRIKVENPTLRFEDIANIPRTQQGQQRMEAIQEVEMTSEGHTRRNEANDERLRPSSLEILNHVKINVGPKTPISVLKGMLEHSSSSELPVTKDQLKKSEDLMIQAFVEFYHQLRLLKNYCFMNQLAFSKIMKKYDKITLRHASKSYLDMVDKSYLGSNEEVSKIMKRVEATFIKHFSNGDHGKGKDILRPKKPRKRHTLTYFLGFLSGCSLALVVTILVLIQSRNIINSQGLVQYMNNIFPLYSLFGFIVLHMVLLSANVYYWTQYRINYPFIFNLKEGTELDYREVFLLSAGLSVLSLAAIISNLDMDMDRRTNNFAAVPELVPLILVCVLVIIMICPFNIIYRSTRYFLVTCFFHSLLAPFYKVTLPDFFMADQLTSQVQAFRSLQFYICYYIWGNFRQRIGNNCQISRVYQIFYIVVAIIPFWIRMLQCMRRLVEENGAMHAYNALKYLSIIIAVAARTLQVQRQGSFLMIIAAATSGVATIYATYWDIVIDWGLLQRKSKNRWLRDKLIVPNKKVYFVAIVLNCLLRLAWMQSVLGFTQAPFIHRKAMIAIVACLEIIRRAIWNFFRLENEHLNNVGKYRAFNSVPLPFYYDGVKHARSRA